MEPRQFPSPFGLIHYVDWNLKPSRQGLDILFTPVNELALMNSLSRSCSTILVKNQTAAMHLEMNPIHFHIILSTCPIPSK